jgi:hypothetical protein
MLGSVWITRRRAAELLECSTNTVDRLIEIGDLHPRKGAPPREGSLDQDEVVALAVRRYAERESATRARQERERRKPLPPDEEHQWLTASQAARVVGMSVMGVYKRVQRGTIPHTDHRGRHWFRRDLMETMGNAYRLKKRGPSAVEEVERLQCAASYAALTADGMRPRSGTS